ncbi:MAG: hypothetical protein J6S85_04655 [Methanobrevibacter sp.]|nr:hypothetical protein [Methanobrevibacter sp.]
MEHQFRIELFITALFITLGVLAIIKIGFSGIKESIFTITTLLEIPVAYFGSKACRKLFYDLIRGKANYED